MPACWRRWTMRIRSTYLIYDYIAVSGTLENRVLEYVDHLHEHFVDPVKMQDGRYMPPTAPGYSITMKHDSIKKYSYPDGPAWRQ